MKRALVIGSNSMLGQELVVQLRTGGDDVVRCGRAGEVDVRFDLAMLGAGPVTEIGPVDAVFVCAASFEENTWEECIRSALVNSVSAFRIAEWAERLGSRHIVMAGTVSSCLEFPQTAYGITKAHGEEAMQFACRRMGKDFVALRMPQLCDDCGLSSRHQPWFSRIIARAFVGGDLRLPAGDCPRNFLHVQDAARALIGAWQAGLAGTHVLVSPESHSYREIAGMAYAAFGNGGAVVDAPEMRPFRPVQFPAGSPEAMALIADDRLSMCEVIARIRDRGTAANFPA